MTVGSDLGEMRAPGVIQRELWLATGALGCQGLRTTLGKTGSQWEEVLLTAKDRGP